MAQGHGASNSLLCQTEDRLHKVEKAIISVKHTKDQLKNNAVEAKSQVRSAVSRQMESLRNREVWLLDQVELLQQTKEDILRKQEDQLQRCLGSLQNSLEYCQDSATASTSGLKRRLSESIERLDDIEMKPLETAHISFKADSASLREAVRRFGHVSSKVMSLEGAFVEPEVSSASLPRTFEDYEDAEHHVLYKTVEEIRQQKWNDESIRVKIPRLSDHVEDWLMPASSTQNLSEPSGSASQGQKAGPSTVPNLHWDMSHWRSPHQMTTPASIQQWLHDIKHDTECEDEDFEVMSAAPTRTESDSIEMIDPSELEKKSKPGFSYFKKVTTSPDANWIASSADGHDNAKLFKSLPGYQLHLQEGQTWLMETEEKNIEMDVKPVKCCAGTCTPVQQHVREALDIENLDRLGCLPEAVSNYFTEMATDSRTWLKTPKKSTEDADADIDETEQAMQRNACKANEPCESISQCLSDELCCTMLIQPNKSFLKSRASMFKGVKVEENNWLHKKKQLENEKFKGLPEVDSQQWIAQQPAEIEGEARVPLVGLHQPSQEESKQLEWLLQHHGSPTTSQLETDLFVKHFRQIINSEYNTWLKNHMNVQENSTVPFKITFDHIPCDKEYWLSKLAGPSEVSSNAPFTLQRLEHCLGNIKEEDWLLSMADEDDTLSSAKSKAMVCQQFYKLVDNVDWLYKVSDDGSKQRSKTELQNSINNMIQGYQNGCNGKNWLMKAEQNPEQDDSEWLLRKESSTEKLEYIGKRDSTAASDLAEWLLNTHI